MGQSKKDMISILLDRKLAGVSLGVLDLTRKLDDQSKLVIRNELERDMFELVVPDVEMQLSDLDGSLYDMFFSAPINTVWKLCIRNNGKVKFRGFVNTDFIKRDQNEEYLNITSFSTMKRFWDVANLLTLNTTPVDDYVRGYYRFIDYLNKYFPVFFQNDILSNIDIDTSLLIRSNTALGTATITVSDRQGVFGGTLNWTYNAAIDRVRINLIKATVKELLIALAKHNNAEWYIDLETETLKLSQRNAIINDLAKDLSDKVVDTDTIEIAFSDEKRYDYVSVFSPINKANVPSLVSMTSQSHENDPVKDYTDYLGRAYGVYDYILASVDSQGKMISCGEILTVDTGPHSDSYASHALITLGIPFLQGLADVAKVRLYRRCTYLYNSNSGLPVSEYGNNFLLVKEFIGNDNRFYLDNDTDGDFINGVKNGIAAGNTYWILDPTIITGSTMWMRYDENNGAWNAPIIDDGTNQPSGTIFDTKPSLTVKSVDGKSESPATEEDIYHLFGEIADYPTLQNRWKDLMITKRKVNLSMNYNDLQLGDAFTLKKITKLKGINDVIVKTTAEDLIAEENQVKLITV